MQSEMRSEKAILYRMVLSDHTCPFGVRAKKLLEQGGYDLDDRVLRTRDEVEACKQEHGMMTTPIIFLGDKLVGGCNDLERHLSDRSH